MAIEFSASFPAELPYLHTIMEWLRERMETFGLSSFEAKKIELAIEEAIVNIIHYAYEQKGGNIELIFQSNDKNSIEILIKDTGVPFNPLENLRPIKRDQTLEEAKIGGLGISLIQTIMDEIHYLREENTNVLFLKKYIYN